jgi:hypothetical protein
VPGTKNLKQVPAKTVTVEVFEPSRRYQLSAFEAWLPPELPYGCSNVTIFFGSQVVTTPRSLAEISAEKSGTELQIRDLPDSFMENMSKHPDYSPRRKNMRLRLESVKTTFGADTVDYPFFPFVSSNRLFVVVQVPFLNQKCKLVMSEPFDSELSNLPKLWDRNFSTNSYVYEIVNENTNPVLQVFYTAPNEIHIHGLFLVHTNQILTSFGGPPQLLNLTSYKFINVTNVQEIKDVSEFLGTNSVQEILTNTLYNWNVPNRKTIFKYPSNRNPNVFAD